MSQKVSSTHWWRTCTTIPAHHTKLWVWGHNLTLRAYILIVAVYGPTLAAYSSCSPIVQSSTRLNPSHDSQVSIGWRRLWTQQIKDKSSAQLQERSHFQAAGSSLPPWSSPNPLDIAANSRSTKPLIVSLVKLMSLPSPGCHANEHSNKEGYIKPITHRSLVLSTPATIPLVFSGGPG